MKQVNLYYTSGSADKEYRIQLINNNNLYSVVYQYGRRGNVSQCEYKIKDTTEDKALKVFEKCIKEKISKGYTVNLTGEPGSTTFISIDELLQVKTHKSLPQNNNITNIKSLLSQQPNPIDEKEVSKYINDNNWGMQPKYDGKHIMVRIEDNQTKYQAFNKKGKPIFIPENVMQNLLNLKKNLEIDGELIGDTYITYDLLSYDNKDLKQKTYHERWKILNQLHTKIQVSPLYINKNTKQTHFSQIRNQNGEGVVFKKLDSLYNPLRPNSGGDMLKYKFYATASCIVLKQNEGKRSVSLGLIDKEIINVGNVTIPANYDIPSKDDIVEIRYLYAYKGGSLYQPIYQGLRDDINHEECLITQLKYKA